MQRRDPWYKRMLRPFIRCWTHLVYPWRCCRWHDEQIRDLYQHILMITANVRPECWREPKPCPHFEPRQKGTDDDEDSTDVS